LYSEVEKEKSTVENLIERAVNIDTQLVTLTTDLEEKRVEVSVGFNWETYSLGDMMKQQILKDLFKLNVNKI